MQLKGKTPPPLSSTPDAKLSRAMERLLQTNDDVDAKLTAFMQANSDTTALYTQLVREHPDHAVRKLMLVKLNKQEEDMRMAKRQLPQVQEWVAQHPGLEERINKRLQNVDPAKRDVAYVRAATEALGRMRFSPTSQSNGIGA